MGRKSGVFTTHHVKAIPSSRGKGLTLGEIGEFVDRARALGAADETPVLSNRSLRRRTRLLIAHHDSTLGRSPAGRPAPAVTPAPSGAGPDKPPASLFTSSA